MGKINVLDFEIANLIAAGEVVERPSSVLKELIENSIDSGADRIVAEIKRGGVSLIRVTDNGCGMTPEDLPVAIKRHATSKIRSRDDLEAITTLGFRGEALAAISSVSKVTIITKTADSEVGSMLTSEGGTVVDISEVGASDGTTVVVEDLFYNVPARRKFLKKDATEAMNVAALVEKVALSRPDIAIQLLVDGNERFSTPGDGDLYNTIYSVFGKDFAKKMIKAEGIANGVKVHGYVGRSDNVKKNRNYENIFINGRYVKSLTAQAAVEKAYTSYIAPEGFPVCVLFLEMNPTMVDVNVHPAKLEVKFAGEQPVFEAIYHTVRTAIEGQEYRPELTLSNQPKNDRNPLGAFVPIGENTRGTQISLGEGRERTVGGISYRQPHINERPTYPHPAESREYPLGDRVYQVSSGVGSSSGSDGWGNTFSYSKTHDSAENKFSYSRSSDSIDKNSSYPHREPSERGYSNPRSAESQSGTEMTPADSIRVLEQYAASTPTPGYERQPNLTESVSAQDTHNNLKSDNSPNSNDNYEQNIQASIQGTGRKIIGEAFNCYVFVEVEGELLVIDKHAAHERIIFEELLSGRRADGRIASQALLIPLTVILSPEEYSAASEHKESLASVGFDYELLDGHVNVTATPDAISAQDAESLFVSMLDELLEGRGNPELTESIRREKALYQIACKAAIKGGRAYDSSITEWLVDKLLSLPDVTVCPHGRPVAFKLKKSELDRRFERLK